jgi:hypothetical protein
MKWRLISRRSMIWDIPRQLVQSIIQMIQSDLLGMVLRSNHGIYDTFRNMRFLSFPPIMTRNDIIAETSGRVYFMTSITILLF